MDVMERMRMMPMMPVIYVVPLALGAWMIRRYRVRLYISRDRNFTPARSRLVSEGMPVGASEAKDSSPRPRLVVIERPKPFIVSRGRGSGNVV
jgi:hypothetical protein